MKATLLFSVFLSLAQIIHAEVLIFPSGQGGKLTIAAGETVIISAYRHQIVSFNPQEFYLTKIVFGGVTNELPLFGEMVLGPELPAAFAGPMDILFSASTNHLISYKRMQGNAIKSVVFSYGHTNTISVPAGKTLRFFSFIPQPNYEFPVNASVTKGTNTLDLGDVGFLHRNAEFSGPLEVTFTVPLPSGMPLEPAAVYSYYFTEDFLVMPETGFLQGPTGAFEISVEKSGDLTNWFPVMVQNTSDAQKAFYRLKLAR